MNTRAIPVDSAAQLRQGAEVALREKAVSASPQTVAALTPEATHSQLHELQVHQIELEMQNEELRRAQHELDASRARYFDLYDLAPVGYCTLSETGLIVEANLTIANLLGVARAALVTKPFSRFIRKEDADSFYRLRQRLLQTGEPQSGEFQLHKPDGTLFWAQLVLARMSTDGDAPLLRLVLSDINARKQVEVMTLEALSESQRSRAALASILEDQRAAEIALLRSNRALKTLRAGNAALLRANHEAELLSQVCQAIVEQGGYRMAWVAYADDNPERSVTPKAWAGIEEASVRALKLSWADNERGQGPVGRAIRTGEPQTLHDIESTPAMEPWHELARAQGCVAVSAFPLRLGQRVIGALAIYVGEAAAFDDEERVLLEELASDLAFGIENLRTRSERDRIALEQTRDADRLRKSLEQSIQTIADTVEARDPYTAGHQRRVGTLAVAIARELGLEEETTHGIRLAATVHDLGKIRVPAEILAKPTRLSEIEFKLIQVHAEAGYEILKNVDFPWPLADIVHQHHERQDGSGYPQGLKGEEILLESRIMAVADVVEAMASHRPYRAALGIEAALAEIERGRGGAYDPAVVDACLKLFRERGFAFQE